MEKPAPPQPNWRHQQQDPILAQALANELDLSPLIASILLSRGHTDPDTARSFLKADLQDLPSPFLLKGMDDAIALVHQACVRNSPVLVYGDYDVDGTSGAAVLGLFLKSLDLQVSFCQPNRFEDGYGVKTQLVQEVRAKYFQDMADTGGLLITVDCGISDHQAVAAAREMGFKVIVTDHHQPPPEAVTAHAIINPWQEGCDFPFKHLAGVGVAFYFMMGIRSHLAKEGFWAQDSPPNLRDYLDLVALGTVADMVPLNGVNRILVKAGLQELEKAVRPGIAALIESSGLTGKRLDSSDISFRLGPRLNAAGRMGDAGRALRLLTTTNEEEGRQLAFELEEENNRRKETEGLLMEQALVQLDQDTAKDMALVLQGNGWHRGVLGIAATKIMHLVYRPVVLLNLENGLARGSARSIPGINLFSSLKECAPLLEGYGGHAMAAGLSVKESNIQRFKTRFSEIVSAQVTPEMLQPILNIDWVLKPDEKIEANTLHDYFSLMPFGQGNPRPVVALQGNNAIHNMKVVGGNHLRFQYRQAGVTMSGIGFHYGGLIDHLRRENALFAVTLHLNSFQGRERAQMQLEDVRFDSPMIL